MKVSKPLILFCLLTLRGLSQIDGIDDAFLKLPIDFWVVAGKPGLYDNRDEKYDYGDRVEICVKNLQLNPDSTFYYYGTSVDSFYFSTGKYRFEGGLYCLNWNEQETKKSIRDSAGFCKIHFPSKTVNPLKVTNVKYIPPTKHSGLTKQPLIDNDLVESFYNSSDFPHKPVRTPYERPHFFVKESGWFKLDKKVSNVWATRMALKPYGRYEELYRQYKGKSVNVAQIDGMVVYIVVYRSSWWSQTNYFFSKTPDSDIFRLNKRNLKKEFYDNPTFLELMKHKWSKCHELDASFYQTFKKYKFLVVEMYKKSLEMNKVK